MKKLGFGLMRPPMIKDGEKEIIDIEQLKGMVDAFIESGFTYFDTAWMYCGFTSENAVKEALSSRHSRDSYTLATKLHVSYVKEENDKDRIFNEQLSKTGAGFFDYYLLHALNAENYEKYKEFDCFEWLKEKKKQGLVRSMGFSFHDKADVLDKILAEHPEMEFVQLQINYLDWENPEIQSRLCYETARKHGKPIIIMEPVKGGTLAKLPVYAEKLMKDVRPDMSVPSFALRFAANLPGVMTVLSGMSNMNQLLDNMSFMKDLEPLSEKEMAVIKKAVDIINSDDNISCTGCSYCTEGCPAGIPIPEYFTMFNESRAESDTDKWELFKKRYADMGASSGLASACVECGQCEGICPQKLPIMKHLKSVSERFE